MCVCVCVSFGIVQIDKEKRINVKSRRSMLCLVFFIIIINCRRSLCSSHQNDKNSTIKREREKK